MTIAIVNQKIAAIVAMLDTTVSPPKITDQAGFEAAYDKLIGDIIVEYPEVMSFNTFNAISMDSEIDFADICSKSVSGYTLNDDIEPKHILAVCGRLIFGTFGAKLNPHNMPNFIAWIDGMRAQNA